MIRRHLIFTARDGELSPDAARIRALIHEVLARYAALTAELVARGVCPARACQLVDQAAMGDPS